MENKEMDKLTLFIKGMNRRYENVKRQKWVLPVLLATISATIEVGIGVIAILILAIYFTMTPYRDIFLGSREQFLFGMILTLYFMFAISHVIRSIANMIMRQLRGKYEPNF